VLFHFCSSWRNSHCDHSFFFSYFHISSSINSWSNLKYTRSHLIQNNADQHRSRLRIDRYRQNIEGDWELLNVRLEFLIDTNNFEYIEIISKIEKTKDRNKRKMHCLGIKPRFLPWKGNALPF
jgi:hypothetical protein